MNRKSARRRLRRSEESGLRRYARSVIRDTYLLRFTGVLILLWVAFSGLLYFFEIRSQQPVFSTFGEALYWGIAAFSTAGIADTPSSPLSLVIGGLWIVTGSVVFFGIIVATITGYFMRPLHRPVHRLIELIEYNLEHAEELTVEELDLLKETTDSLIEHMERLKAPDTGQAGAKEN